jgi:hypothetical protein
LDQLVFSLENMFNMPVAVAVTPDPVEMPVATMVKPLVFHYHYITMMVPEVMQRFVMFHFM